MDLEQIMEKLTPEEGAFVSALIDKDPLTGVYNRRKFDRDIALVVAMSERTKRGSSLIIIDIDHFKKYNDDYGHQKGDEVLKKVTGCLEKSLRDYDKIHIYRYGGEEFVIIISDITVQDAAKIGDRLRKNVRNECAVTVSVGISHYKEVSDNIKSLLKNADDALYRAKQGGRDRVAIYEKNT
ncbi:MAG: GGDEF domain-containing protein [Deltaproteobacteria bacterium]|nr:GGDEF domain-containing protein [Deltaproteobacteria bacterium]